jgi:cell division protein FtsA
MGRMISKRQGLIVGLDIGTAAVVAVVVEPGLETMTVLGIGAAASEGLRKGVVVDMESTAHAISSAVREAELSAGCDIHTVYASVSGGHVKGFNSHGVVALKGKEIDGGDVERVSEAARAVPLPQDQDILHVLTQEFVVDGQDGIRDPIGMSGVRLEARVHIVTTSIAPAQNVMKCCQRANLHVADLSLAALAAAEVVVTPEEREMGVAVLDVGAGTAGLVAFEAGAVKHTAVLAVGGNHVSSDLSAGLRTPFREAEQLKLRYGAVLESAIAGDETIEVSMVGARESRRLPRRILAEIMGPRYREIFTMARHHLERTGLEQLLASGVVLTGGSVLAPGTADLAEHVFGLPVRIGAPVGFEGLEEVLSGPGYTAALGLTRRASDSSGALPAIFDGEHVFARFKRSIADWFRDFV